MFVRTMLPILNTKHPTIVPPFFHFLCLCSFCPSLAVIASVLQLSDNIAGVTILAFGNGAPDIFTSLVSGTDEGIIMFTELIGAGVFVTAIIAGSVAVVKPFRVLLKPLMRDACFYIVTVCWISYVIKDGTVHLWEAISTYTSLNIEPLRESNRAFYSVIFVTRLERWIRNPLNFHMEEPLESNVPRKRGTLRKL